MACNLGNNSFPLGIDNMRVEDRCSFSSRDAKLRKGASRAAKDQLSTLWKDPASRLKPSKHNVLGQASQAPFHLPTLPMWLTQYRRSEMQMKL